MANLSDKITPNGVATLAGPTFTGVPSGPTATAGTDTTQLATTAFVKAAALRITISATEPTSPTLNDLWVDTS